MRKFLLAMMVAIAAVSIGVSSAEAKRLGGGNSIGKQSQGVSRQAPMQSSQAPASAAKPAAPAATPQAAAPKPASPWKGILGGALLGLGLGALLSHFGLGGAAASIISTILMVALLAMAAMFIYRMLRGRHNGAGSRFAYAGPGAARTGYAPEIGSGITARDEPTQPAALQGAQLSGSQAPWGVPADFDSTGFLRQAKTYFIRLQAAWDKADINDIREFATPEMFAELKMQLQERGASPNATDVVSLDAELLGIESDSGNHLARVKFSGMIRESENAQAEPFAEVWNLSKPVSGRSGWMLAGIQQIA